MARRKPIRLGDTARDTITGYEGVTIAVTDWLYGCRRITLQPRDMKDGRPVEPESFDEDQLVLVDDLGRVPAGSPTGGPRPEPVRRTTPPAR